jgi:hypothetical protein
MVQSPTSWLPIEAAHALHRRLLEEDPVAPSDLADAYLEPLSVWMVRQNPRIDEDLCVTAAEDAILNLGKNPRSYDSSRGTLDAYLRMAAKGDLKNLLARERKHRERRVPYDSVELSPHLRKYVQDEDSDPQQVAVRHETVNELHGRLRVVRRRIDASLSPAEARVMDLMQAGERKTTSYAEALGITHLAPADQRREVKRVKDRLSKRLVRAGGAV